MEESRSWKEDCGRIYLVDEEGDQLEELSGVFFAEDQLWKLQNELVKEFDLSDLLTKIDEDLNEFGWIPAE